MTRIPDPSRRRFVSNAVVMVAASSTTMAPALATAGFAPHGHSPGSAASDMSWLSNVQHATDRVLFDWSILGDAGDPQVLWFAERYLQGCEAVYGPTSPGATIVFNVRTMAVPAALSDEVWRRYPLGAEAKANDPHTSAFAVRNPFWHAGPEPAPGVGTTSLARFIQRGAIVLVCDIALGHLATRLATASHQDRARVHTDLKGMLIPGAYLMPSGVFGMAKAQNAGCALMTL